MEKKQIDFKKAIRLYRDEEKSTPEVSKIVGCSIQTLIDRLSKAGVRIRSSGELREKVKLETIRHEYEDLGMSITKIAQKHEMNPSSIEAMVYGKLIKDGVQMRDRKEEARKGCTKISVSEYQTICDRYKTNKSESCTDIANDYDVSVVTITGILKKNGITPEHEGARIKSYNGGITKLHTRIRNCERAKFWQRACMERDDYKCRISEEKGQLQVHHYPKSFSKIFNEFLAQYPDLNPIKDCDKLFQLSQGHEQFWDIDNGMTVTIEMHKKLHMHNGIKDSELLVLHDQWYLIFLTNPRT
jgi:hypothetical protein